MSSRRVQLLAAIAAALEGSGKPAGLNVHRARLRPLEKDLLPAAIVYVPPETPEAVTLSPLAVDRKARVAVQLRAIAPEGTAAEDAVDPYYVWAVQAIQADPTLGGLALDTNEVSVTYDAIESDSVLAACEVLFEVTYETAESDPEMAP